MRTNGHPLQITNDCAKIDTRRKLEIFSQMVRHFTALIYLVAELVIGVKPEKL